MTFIRNQTRKTKMNRFNYALAYVYARGYFDGRANGSGNTPLDWMTPEEVGIYAEGYDRGVSDYCQIDNPEAAA